MLHEQPVMSVFTKKKKNKERKKQVPAFLGNDRQDPSPLAWIYFVNFSSSSAVHLPFFKPTFSQQGALPICLQWETDAATC